MISAVSADYYYEDSGTNSLNEDTSFTIPEYESQKEVLTKLVAPFLFLSVVLQVLFNRALRFAFVDDSRSNDLLDLVQNNKPNLNREATLMSITATAILVPTPFWNYVIFAVGSIGVMVVTIIAAAALLLLYYFLKG